MEREKRLILEGSPCVTNYFNRNILTVEQAKAIGKDYCPMFSKCDSPNNNTPCLLRSGLEIAQYVINGISLEKEMENFSKADFIEEECRYSKDRKTFEIIKGKAKVLDAVERFARTILLMNPSESVFPRCDKCFGVKLTKEVYDSIHDDPFPLSGSGKTIRRSVEYCPECEEEPRGGVIKQDPADDEDLRIIRSGLDNKL